MIYTTHIETKVEERAVDRLKKGMAFGLFGEHLSCYFEDATRVSYNELWAALKVVYNLGVGHNKTLNELCGNKYIGMTNHRFSKLTWHTIYMKNHIEVGYHSVAPFRVLQSLFKSFL